MGERDVHSLAEYVETIHELTCQLNKGDLLRNEVLLFRGQSDKNYELLPSIARKRKTSVDVSIFNEERNLIELAKYKLPDVFKASMEPIELLALLQHHGVPTRLLDVSESALVSLYFACCESKDKDGEVIVFSYNETDVVNYPIINALAESYKFVRGTYLPIMDFYEAIIDQPYFSEQRYRERIIEEEVDKKVRWIQNCCDGIIPVYAPVRSIRQQVQHGRYILFPNRISETVFQGIPVFESIIDPISKDDACIAGRISIPQSIKKGILEELSFMGISEASLFCDNIDTVCKGIKETCELRIRREHCMK